MHLLCLSKSGQRDTKRWRAWALREFFSRPWARFLLPPRSCSSCAGPTAWSGPRILTAGPNLDRETVVGVFTQHVAPGSQVYTDGPRCYLVLRGAGYRLEQVNHTAGEYVRGEVKTTRKARSCCCGASWRTIGG
jgi:hypothetical protein